MLNHESGITDVLREGLRDAQDLVRSEIALAKAEARAELSRIGTGVALLAGAAVTAIIGMVLLMFTIAWLISESLAWPVWAGFGLVTLAMLLLAGVLGAIGKSRLTAERRMPRTVETLKENMEWMKARTS
jgi:hypothetical protein